MTIGWIWRFRRAAGADIEPGSIGERAGPGSARPGLNLFLVGFVVLFLELACIRWFSAYVVFLHFFSNVVLIASFLGMSCGCLAARDRRDWLGHFPWIALGGVVAALGMLAIYHYWTGLVIAVGDQRSPQEVFFGTEARLSDVARFVVPIEPIAAIFFVLIALMFVGLGQVLGRAFDAYPRRVLGYTLNIGGSLAGIAGFSALSFAESPPIFWFLVACSGIAYLQHQQGSLTRWRALALIALLAGFSVPMDWLYPWHDTRWSPYYMIDRDTRFQTITVDNLIHQGMVASGSGGAVYSLIYSLQRHSGGTPFQDVLVIGAGSGNDIAHGLNFNVRRIDAVEIDPVIEDIGARYHPDRPYQDPRVTAHIDDGRHYLQTTDRKYDLVVYALVDSLVLHSSYANIRLESYLFTQQAFADVRRVLRPDGIFVMYNYMRQGWVVERVAAMAESAFGCPPLIFSLPFAETLESSAPPGFTVMIAGCNHVIAEAFARYHHFWLAVAPSRNFETNGFTVEPRTVASEEEKEYERIEPATLIHDGGQVLQPTDDWPFLYLRGRFLPGLTLRSMLIMAGLGLSMVYLFLPRRRAVFDNRMFFLGAAFMLLETKAVVQMALLFGSTWIVNSVVLFGALILILLANLYVLRSSEVRLPLHYGLLLAFLAAGVLVPLNAFLTGGVLWHYVAPSILSLGPIFFAGVIFARSFRGTPNPDHAFASNIGGAVVGGLCESLSTVLGFHGLILLAIAFYALSIWSPGLRRMQTA